MDRARERYQPRHAEASVLHAVIRDHLDDFLRAAAARADGAGLPEFIAREFREFLTCGVLRLICSDAKAPIPSPRDFDREMLRRAKGLLDGWIPLATRRPAQGFLEKREKVQQKKLKLS